MTPTPPADPAPTPHGADDALELRVLAWVFGDDDEDPGLIVDDASNHSDLIGFLDRLGADHAALKRALGAPDHPAPVPADSPAQARLAALRDEILRRRAGAPIDWATARGDNVRSLSAHRTRARRPGPRIILAGAFAVVAAAALIFLVTRPGPPPHVDAAVASALTADLVEDHALGFGGAAQPTARDRGFLLGALIDLSRPNPDGTPRAAADSALALTLAERALSGLAAPEEPARRLARALGGCASILADPADRAACENGLQDYLARRDAWFSSR